jgi:hypothetical protein
MTTIIVEGLESADDCILVEQSLKRLGPDYEVRVDLEERAWVEVAVETVRVFIQHHSHEVAAVSGYVLGKIGDLAIEWAKESRKRHRQSKPRRIIIYGPDRQPIRDVLIEGDHPQQ